MLRKFFFLFCRIYMCIIRLRKTFPEYVGKESNCVSMVVLIFIDLSRSIFTCFILCLMRRRIPDRIWFWFLRFVHWFKRGRGSPRFTRLVDLAGSEKSKRLVVSHTRKGDFVHFGASLRIMYTAVAHRPTPRPLGIEAIPRLVNRVLSLSFVFFSLPPPPSLSFTLYLSFSIFRFALLYYSVYVSSMSNCPRQIVLRYR